MSDTSGDFDVKVRVDTSDAIPALEALIEKQSQSVDGFKAIGDAAGQSASAQVDAARTASDAIATATAAETDAMIRAGRVALEQIRARAAADAAAAAQGVTVDTAAIEARTAVAVNYYRFLTEMGQQSLAENRSRIEALLADESRSFADRTGLLRELARIDSQIVQESIADYRAEAEAGVLSAQQQKAALQSIAEEASYSVATRRAAAEEIARIEALEAKQSAEAVALAEREKTESAQAQARERVAIARQEASQEREARSQRNEFGMALANAGYALPGGAGSALLNAGYLVPEITSMSGPMLAAITAIVGAFAAADAAVALFTDSVKKAASAEDDLATVGGSIKAQGGDWDAARGSVEEFANAVRRATQYSESDALQALNTLTSAGVAYSDAERIVAVSTDVAAGSHRALIDVVDRIKEAEAGRGTGLAQLDTHLKTLIHTHADLSQILDTLSRDYAGSAADALDTYQGRTAQLRNEIDFLQEEIGLKLLPALKAGTEVLIGMADEAEHQLPKIESFFSTIVAEAQSALAPIMQVAGALEHVYGLGGLIGTVLGGPVGGVIGTALGAATTSAGGANAGYTMHRYTAQQLRDLEANGSLPQGAQVGGVYWTPNETSGSGSGGGSGNWLSDAIAKATADMRHDEAEGQRELEAIQRRALQNDLPVGNVPAARHHRAKRDAAPFEFQPADDKLSSQATDALGQSQTNLDATLKALTDSEKGYSEAVKTATSAQQRLNAELALAYKQTGDARIAIDALQGVMGQEKTKLEDLSASLPKLSAAYEDARAKFNSYGESLGKSPTAPEKQKLDDYKKSMDAAFATYDSTTKEIAKLNTALESNGRSLADAKANADAYAAALSKVSDELAKSVKAEKDLAQSEGAERERAIQKVADEEAVYGKSLQQQLAYYDRRYSAAESAANQFAAAEASDLTKAQALVEQLRAQGYSKALVDQIAYYENAATIAKTQHAEAYKEAQSYLDEVGKLDEQQYQQRVDALKQYNEQAITLTSTFVDDVVAKHESLRDSLKDVFKSIEQDFVQMIEKMIVESKLLQPIEKQFGALLQSIFGTTLNTGKAATDGSAGGGLSSIFGGGAGSAPSGGGILQSIMGTTGASQAISSFDTNDGLLGLFGGTQLSGAAAQSVTSSIASSGVGGSGGGGAGGWASDAGQIDMSGLAGGSYGLSAGDVIGGGVEGAGLGSILAGALGENQGNASIGGAIGGAVGSIGGPLGSAIGSVAGSLLGGLFGNHATAATSPDIYNTQQYGSIIADLMGTSGANGQYFSEDSSTLQDFGGATGIAGIEELLARGQQAFTQSTGLTAQQYQQYLAMFGSSSTGSGSLNFDKNIGQEYITGADGAGGTYSYQQFGQALTAIESGLNAHGGANAAIPVFTVSQSYPNANLSTMSQTGTVYGPATTSPNLAGNTPINTSSTTEPTQQLPGSTPQVNVTINGSVIGPGGIDTVAQQIGAAMRRLHAGEAPGAYTNTVGTLSFLGDAG